MNVVWEKIGTTVRDWKLTNKVSANYINDYYILNLADIKKKGYIEYWKNN